MCSACLRRTRAFALLLLIAGMSASVTVRAEEAAAPTTAAASAPRVLRIAADPNNMPFSNRRLEGFENKIADLIARDLGATVEYTWLAQRLGFFRMTMRQ